MLFQYPSLYQNVTEGKFTFIDRRESPEEKRKIQPMHIEPGLYPSIVDIVVAMNKFENVWMHKNMNITEFMYQ